MIAITPAIIRKMVNVIFQVELSGDSDKIYKLSRSAGGKSGWSFGKIQHDYPNNPKAERILRDCGVSIDALAAILGVYDSNHPLILKLNKQLQTHNSKIIIDSADQAFVQDAFSHFEALSLPLDSELRLAIALEYHVQMNITENGKFHNWIANCTADDADFLAEYEAFKATLPWHRKGIRPDYFGSDDHNRRVKMVLAGLEMEIK